MKDNRSLPNKQFICTLELCMWSMSAEKSDIRIPDTVLIEEPDLPDIPDADKPIVRNVLYVIWALQHNSDPYVSWQVQTKHDGYIVLVSLSTIFCLTLRDLQLIADVNPLRIVSVCIRSQVGFRLFDLFVCF